MLIRGARPRDRDSILAFTQNTFRWGDYLSHTWDDWVHASDGKLLVAEAKGRVVGNLHFANVGRHEAWFEGMRVHPDYRKLGIAAALDGRARELARAAGCRVVRLETASDNYAAQSALTSFGYRRVLTLKEWASKPLRGPLMHTRLARRRDLEEIMALWERSWMRKATRSLMPLVNPWHWASFTRSRVGAALRESRVYVTPAEAAPQGLALVSGETDAFEAMLVVGRARAVGELFHDLRVLAGRQGHKKCYLAAPDSPRFREWALRNGFKSEAGGMLIYEQAI